MYPVFAQYTPPYRCESVFDNNDDFSWLTWKQIENLTTTDTPYCSGFDSSDLSSGCGHCVFDPISIDSCDHQQSFEALKTCLGKPAQEIANWTNCNDQFNFDCSLRNRTNLLFDAGEPWETAVTQFKLICGDEWFDSLSTALGLLSLMIGAYIAGIYVDRFGRKNAIMVWNVITGICLTIHAFMPNQYGFLAMRVLGNGLGHVSYLSQKAYSMELLGPSRRAISGALASGYYSIGYISSGLVAFFLPDWRGFTLAYAGIAFATLLTHPFYPESPLFLYSRGRKEEARKVYKEMGKKTNTEISDDLLEKVERDILKRNDDKEAEEVNAEQYTILDLFRHRDLALVSLNVGFAFLVNTLVYYGLSFNVASFAGSIYVNNTINGVVELLGYVLVALSLDKFGRRWINGGFMIFGGVACLICMALEEAARKADDPATLLEAQRWMAFAGKFFISGSFGAIYVYGAELFPTPLRSTGIGFGSMFGRIGGFLAPFIIQIKKVYIFYLIFGAFGVIGGLLVFLLPETAGQPICQTLDEALEFYARNKKSRKSVNVEENKSDEENDSSTYF
ncbi:Oidioi.mRNA.OKI2018_I69.chr1.g3719.t1.cds [Oikopleura dioica]|uniref:Oidioi.mRNA.OKI2018_I69.chr1.g3719.t1.cds n=1 Tax=Oikopleura dioica TaxID=34765 RepID=A0ABN7SUY6_OIKDI|nr:Oidioi.mRNA.OKI2018_I69.chr1.g3719.t1.cds [Oikopleura dioica]